MYAYSEEDPLPRSVAACAPVFGWLLVPLNSHLSRIHVFSFPPNGSKEYNYGDKTTKAAERYCNDHSVTASVSASSIPAAGYVHLCKLQLTADLVLILPNCVLKLTHSCVLIHELSSHVAHGQAQ